MVAIDSPNAAPVVAQAPQIKHYLWREPARALHVRHDQAFPTAWLVMDDKADLAQMKALTQSLKSQRWTVAADRYNGKPALRIRGFDQDTTLLSALKKAGAISKDVDEVHDIVKAEGKSGMEGLKQWAKDNSMVAAGISYLVADGLIFASGAVRKDVNGMAQGLSWGLTSAILAIFGTPDPKHQMESLYVDMKRHFEQSGTPPTPDQQQMLRFLQGHPDHFTNKFVDFIYEYPTEIFNTLQGYGGMQGFLAGINQKKFNPTDILNPKGQPNYFKMAAGLCVAGGMWGALLIREDPEAGMTDAEKEKKFLDRLEGKPEAAPKAISVTEDPINWVKQKPLRLAGYGAMLNNFLVGIGAVFHEQPDINHYFKGGVRDKLMSEIGLPGELGTEEARINKSGDVRAILEMDHKKAALAKIDKAQMARRTGVKFDALSPFPNIMGNWLYSLSPKDRSGKLKEAGYLDELYTMAANMLENAPPEQRAERLTKFAGFMAGRKEMKSSVDEIIDAVNAKLAQLKDNPWAIALELEKEMPDHHTLSVSHVAKGVQAPAVAAQHATPAM